MSHLVYAKRTPFGKINGALSSIRVDDLLSILIRNAVADFFNPHQISTSDIDDVVIGCANQAGEDNRNLARMSVLLADLPYSIPGTTINRLCGSSLDAIFDAHAKIKAGLADIIIVGGAESMTRAPYVLSKPQSAYDREQKLYDSTFGWRFKNTLMEKRFPLLSMGETAEEVANRYQISRQEQDEFALHSHLKSSRAIHLLKEEIHPISFTDKKNNSTTTFDRDECIRSDSSMASLEKLKPVFSKTGSVTAGNASPMNDGASIGIMVSNKILEKFPVLKNHSIEITGAAVMGLDPSIMGMGPVFAINKLLKQISISQNEIDLWEINEAFSSQALAVAKELKIPAEKLNPQGGAIAIGHPLGASGMRLAGTIFHQMKRNHEIKNAIASMCIGVGQGIAVSFKNNFIK